LPFYNFCGFRSVAVYVHALVVTFYLWEKPKTFLVLVWSFYATYVSTYRMHRSRDALVPWTYFCLGIFIFATRSQQKLSICTKTPFFELCLLSYCTLWPRRRECVRLLLQQRSWNATVSVTEIQSTLGYYSRKFVRQFLCVNFAYANFYLRIRKAIHKTFLPTKNRKFVRKYTHGVSCRTTENF